MVFRMATESPVLMISSSSADDGTLVKRESMDRTAVALALALAELIVLNRFWLVAAVSVVLTVREAKFALGKVGKTT